MTPALRSRTRPLEDRGDLLGTYASGGVAWLHDGAGLVGRGVAASLPVTLADAPAAAAELLASVTVDDPLSLPGTGPVLFAAFPFDRAAPGRLVLPSHVVGANRQGQAWSTTVTAVPGTGEHSPAPEETDQEGDGNRSRTGPDDPPAARPVPSRYVLDGHASLPAWTSMVERALARIAAGTLDKVVLARRVTVEADVVFDLAAVSDRLRRDHPSCFVYAMGGFVGASPELLVRRRGALVVSRPMAGTVERGDTLDADRQAVEAMASSAKQLSEHRLVVDAVREMLAPWCEEVSASATPEVARLATVAHLATTVAGRLRGEPPPSALAVADRLHPTPAVGGSPRSAAVDLISDLEGFDRGRYAGPVGWVDGRGDGDWAVAVRCASVTGATAELVAGAGIVAGSDPAAEWAETQAKLEPMLRALVRV